MFDFFSAQSIYYVYLTIYISDCYNKKDQIDIPTKDYQRQQQLHLSSAYPKSSSPAIMNPGLHAELEHGLRQYARVNQKNLETNLLSEMFRALDKYGTGKILKNQVKFNIS